ncbi:MAG: NAD(P)-dependent glycerol-3-phosphate dehydrogenase [Acidimicrobiia bacterium]|nr:NAD(P)-dependent glycerol-3-phosphate dehydrogenase [Acidimicrobiia bacterium]
MRENTDTAVVGGGSWGTALACHLARRGVKTLLWAREPEVVEGINDEHRNPLFLSDVEVPASLRATGDLDAALTEASILVSSVPTQFVRPVFSKVAASLDHIDAVVSVSKGIEIDTLLTPTQILAEVLPEALTPRLLALSGPSFAAEVAAGIPTAVVAAGTNPETTRLIQRLFSNGQLRVYGSDDLVGVELGGALKNVIAIGTGIVDGLGLGRNTRAALITRGLAELARLGVARGGNPLTFAGLSGIGDLVLTCTGDLSRNRQVGLGLGRGQTLTEVLSGMTEVAEGVKTTAGARQLAAEAVIDMPITEQVYQVLYEGKAPRASVLELMGRELREERA